MEKPRAANTKVWYYVILYSADITRISNYLGLSEQQFCKQYGVVDNLINITGGDCPFITENNLCSIHEVKPSHCANVNICERESAKNGTEKK